MQHHYTPLALLSFLLLVPLVLIVTPTAEWGVVAIYFFVLAVLARSLYQHGLQAVDPTFPTALFALALFVKLMGSAARYWTVVDLYDGAADAPHYHQQGQLVAQYFKVFDFSILSTYQFRGDGTTNMVHLTALLYTLLPPSMAGAFFFFAGLAFAGSVFYYRAVCIAWPAASKEGYRLFIFFLPSILFWPASLGKDAWLFFCSSLVVWGWASYTRQSSKAGLLLIVAGLALISPIRPHIAAFLAVAMGGAYFLYSTRQNASFVNWLVGALAVGIISVYLVQSGAAFLELDELSVAGVEDRYLEQQERTFTGGSRYSTGSIFTPAGIVLGLATALARPFPWEANNLQVLIAALETTGWLVFCGWQFHRFVYKLRHLRTDPVASFALFYSLIGLLALTALGNFGILARQRVMMLPFFWMLFL